MAYKNQRKQQHSRQQDKIRECIADGCVQALLRVIVYRRIRQPGINLRGPFYVFQIVPGTVILKNGDAGQLGGFGLNTLQEVTVGRHGVIFALQLAEQAVLCVQVIRK